MISAERDDRIPLRRVFSRARRDLFRFQGGEFRLQYLDFLGKLFSARLVPGGLDFRFLHLDLTLQDSFALLAGRG